MKKKTEKHLDDADKHTNIHRKRQKKVRFLAHVDRLYRSTRAVNFLSEDRVFVPSLNFNLLYIQFNTQGVVKFFAQA